MTSDESLDFSMPLLPYLFRLQPSVSLLRAGTDILGFCAFFHAQGSDSPCRLQTLHFHSLHRMPGTFENRMAAADVEEQPESFLGKVGPVMLGEHGASQLYHCRKERLFSHLTSLLWWLLLAGTSGSQDKIPKQSQAQEEPVRVGL